ncbi:MAG: electron transport complex subunit RsxC [Ruminococcus sp.]|jgi:electron transport complex protein RnfC|nr:electron transport complex subunit RsxC [Ruminococcus sp.]
MGLASLTLSHKKNTKDNPTAEFALPSEIVLPLSQTIGAPCEPIVQKGDLVKTGQKVGDSKAAMSAPIHSSISGEVTEIFDFLNPDGRYCKALRIKSDGEDTRIDFTPPEIDDRQSFIYAVRESGLSGLGGASFPTHIKLAYDPIKNPIDTLVINGAECEPHITSDYRCFMEDSADIIEGILLVMKHMGIPHCVIGIENNKPEAIKIMNEKTRDLPAVKVLSLAALYPQGAEKVIVHSATGRIIGEGQLPADQNVMVLNVTTCAFIAKYIRTGIPLITKRITLDGTSITKNAGNYNVRIGTPIQNLLDFAGVEKVNTLLYGGPMMGISLYDTTQPILKNTNAVLAFAEDISAPEPTACIRCGFCMTACPLNLMPMHLARAYQNKDKEDLKKLKLNLCMNCGCCSYVCPAKRPLAEYNQLAKAMLRG